VSVLFPLPLAVDNNKSTHLRVINTIPSQDRRCYLDVFLWTMSLNQLIYNYFEWQAAKHNRGEKVLAAWKDEFPNEIDGATAAADDSSRTYTVVRKGTSLRAPALFFDKEDACSCIPGIKDGDDTGDSVEFQEFSSLFTALASLLHDSGNSKQNEEPGESRIEPKESKPSRTELVPSGSSDTKQEEPTPSEEVNSEITPKPMPSEEANSEITPKPTPAEEVTSSSKVITTGSTKDTSTTPSTPTQAPAEKDKEKITNNNRKHPVSPDSLQTMFSSPKRQKVDDSSEEVKKQDTDATDATPEETASREAYPNYRLKAVLWEQRYEELALFWDGETTVYQTHISQNKSLTNWVKHQRKCYKRGQVAPERMEKLESIGFKWIGRNSVVMSNQPHDEAELAAAQQQTVTPVVFTGGQDAQDDRNDAWSALWDIRFQELLDYKGRFGDTKVPKEWPENKKLAGWVRKQREQYRKQASGENNAMTEARKNKLIDLGFVWSLRPGRLKHPLPPLPEAHHNHNGQECIMGKEDDRKDVEPYFVDRNGYLII
jgi:hypothetical protein